MRPQVVAAMLAASVCAGQEAAAVRLTLKNAVDLALAPDGNVRIQLAAELIRQAEARARQARAALLPNFDGSSSVQSLTRNLAAFGVRFDAPLAGFRLPVLAGPLDVTDTRVTASQSLFDFTSIRRLQTARAAVAQAEAEQEAVREQVAAQVARAYLACLRAEAAVETAQANIALAEALVKLSASQKEAGTGTAIEVTRARVQLANEQQRLLVARNDRHRTFLQLERTLGAGLGRSIELAEKLAFTPLDEPDAAQALAVAAQQRADLRAQLRRQETQRLTMRSVMAERLPSITAFGDYGVVGLVDGSQLPTRVAGATLRIPVFDGGRRDARRAETAIQLRQEEIRTRDLRQQLELEVRTAIDNLRSANGQVKAADEGLELANSELEQARRRYTAGVSTSLEITDAQARLERARENRIQSLYLHNLARIDLAAAMGAIFQVIQ